MKAPRFPDRRDPRAPIRLEHNWNPPSQYDGEAITDPRGAHRVHISRRQVRCPPRDGPPESLPPDGTCGSHATPGTEQQVPLFRQGEKGVGVRSCQRYFRRGRDGRCNPDRPARVRLLGGCRRRVRATFTLTPVTVPAATTVHRTPVHASRVRASPRRHRPDLGQHPINASRHHRRRPFGRVGARSDRSVNPHLHRRKDRSHHHCDVDPMGLRHIGQGLPVKFGPQRFGGSPQVSLPPIPVLPRAWHPVHRP